MVTWWIGMGLSGRGGVEAGNVEFFQAGRLR